MFRHCDLQVEKVRTAADQQFASLAIFSTFSPMEKMSSRTKLNTPAKLWFFHKG